MAFGGLGERFPGGHLQDPQRRCDFSGPARLAGHGRRDRGGEWHRLNRSERSVLPDLRGEVILTDNTANQPGPSYQEEYYTTAVHEFGHALGLQHTWTGAAMSQDVIRDTSRARPLDADDIAGLLVLYGKAGWSAAYGSISGQVTANGNPVNMASVVAIPPTGPAVSALTNPDGTYTINGLPPNQYLLYVHPLPPDAVPANGTGLSLPVDSSGHAMAGPSGYFQTVFYPGTLDPGAGHQFHHRGGDEPDGPEFRGAAADVDPHV